MTKAAPISAQQAVSTLPQTGAARKAAEGAHSLLSRMQSAHGNQGMVKLMSGVLQRKLTINQPGDAFEQEADRMADTIMRMPDPGAAGPRVTPSGPSGLQRCSCGKSAGAGGECEQCQAVRLQRSSASPSQATSAPTIVHEVLDSPGQPLDADTRSFMEPRFGRDFSDVRVHTDARAAESARAVDALAYTVGNAVVFNQGQYIPASASGQRILAHELTHVVQQGFAAPRQSQVLPGSVKTPTAEKPLMRSPAKLQRQTCDVGVAPGMACTDAQGTGHGPGVNLEHFPINQSALQPAHTATLDAFQRSWVAHGSLDAVQVHGYASCDGPANANVQLSCDRAATVGADLGGRGIANTTFAHGETNEFGAALDANRRVVIRGVNLIAGRFAGNAQLERVLHNELLIRRGSTDAASIQLIQQSLIEQGYTLPGFGVDGIFGPETEATVKQFQTDLGIIVDGIVGPETMAALDRHDITNLVGPGPVAKIGPVPGPLPPPARGCDFPYTGVAFALAHPGGAGVAPAAAIASGLAPLPAGGTAPFVALQGIHPARYAPDVTVHAPNDARAQEFQVGFISNVLSTDRNFNFTGGHRIHTQVAPIPIKDGAPLISGHYNTIFVQDPAPGVLATFPANNATVNLVWPDVPGDGAFFNLLDNPICAGLPAQTMTSARMFDEFRTWVAVRHQPTGCVRTLHHIDWNLLWSATVTPGAPLPAVAVTNNAINVTQPNGNGAPGFIQGGPVPADVARAVCT